MARRTARRDHPRPLGVLFFGLSPEEEVRIAQEPGGGYLELDEPVPDPGLHGYHVLAPLCRMLDARMAAVKMGRGVDSNAIPATLCAAQKNREGH